MKSKKHMAEQFQLAGVPTEDQEMGAQLTDQYHRAIGGMRDVLLFGAMMIKLREVLSARGQNFPKRGPKAKGQGVDGWLATNAPAISRQTAYRFMSVAEAVQESFKIPAKAEKTLGFAGFVTAKPEDLPAPLQKKQLELFEFVDGTSQRSWLDRLRPSKARGGDITPRDGDGKRIKKTPEADSPELAALDIWQPILRDLELHGIHERTWAHLPQDQLDRLDGLLIDLQRLRKEGATLATII